MKIKNQYNKVISQKNVIEQQNVINKSNIDNVADVNSINQYIKKLTTLDADWVTLEHYIDESFFPTNSARIVFQILAYEWVIDLSFLPDFLIPYLNVKILYRSPENLLQRATDDSLITFITNHTIQSEDIGNNNFKTTLIGKIFVKQRTEGELEIEDIEAKLLLTLQNPNNYV